MVFDDVILHHLMTFTPSCMRHQQCSIFCYKKYGSSNDVGESTVIIFSDGTIASLSGGKNQNVLSVIMSRNIDNRVSIILDHVFL